MSHRTWWFDSIRMGELCLKSKEVHIGSSSQPVTVYTDHNPFIFLQLLSNANRPLMRWSLICQSYYLKICHKKGINNVIADSLSRFRFVLFATVLYIYVL